MGVEQRFELSLPLHENIVTWYGPGDAAKPINWSNRKKWTIVITTSLMTFVVSFGSSVFSAMASELASEFDTSQRTMILGVSSYVVGFSVGPMIWGPASELYGRTSPLWLGFTLFCIFQFPLALAKDTQTALTARFFAGLFGSAPLAIIAGMYVDFLGPVGRGISTAIFSTAAFSGPVVGPIVGSFMTQRFGWRASAWTILLLGVIFGSLCFLCTPETAEHVILGKRAQQIRWRTRRWELHAQCEEKPRDTSEFVQRYLTKPLRMIAQEPVLIIFTLYMSLVYGILYLTLTLYPFAFATTRGWKPTIASLPFLSILCGILIACVIIGLHGGVYLGRRYQRGEKPAPEDRLLPVAVGSFLLPLGLFTFGWTAYPSVSWIPQVLSGAFIGCGIILVFMNSLSFLVEVYLLHANSALAINNFVRCLAAASFPFFSTSMFARLGVQWSASMLGFVCIGLAPFPLIMMRYGKQIRGWSKFAMK